MDIRIFWASFGSWVIKYETTVEFTDKVRPKNLTQRQSSDFSDCHQLNYLTVGLCLEPIFTF